MTFEGLKKAFTSALVLAHVDPQKPFIIEADASNFALASILSRQGNDEKLHPLVFHHANLTPPKSTTRDMTRIY